MEKIHYLIYKQLQLRGFGWLRPLVFIPIVLILWCIHCVPISGKFVDLYSVIGCVCNNIFYW
jgi:hypothetical protein